MGFTTVVVETSGAVQTLILNRPDKLNALNSTLLAELREALERAQEDASVKVLILTGAGPKAFVAGADIAEFADMTPAEAVAFSRRGQQLFDAIERSPKPVIAAVNGFALGGGCELAMACHLRVAATTAAFGQPEVKLGIIPGYGGTQRLPRLVGRGRALELLLTGRTIDAATALSWGLVNRVAEPEALRQAALALAEEILGVSPVAVGYCLEAVRAGLAGTQEQGMEAEASLFGLCFASEDRREGVGAFLEKRKPNFPGR